MENDSYRPDVDGLRALAVGIEQRRKETWKFVEKKSPQDLYILRAWVTPTGLEPVPPP